ncbi:MAG: DUF386 domain-containing protein [Clostridiales bacterium]|jgi:YhcH/YjgK/YiaL family protein|nr:DUF386 domain-containing protein [Clostridiales bacterium]
MIFDRLSNLSKYSSLIPDAETILLAIEKVASGEYTEEKIYLDGDRLFLMAQEYESVDREGRYLEAHRKYIDLQAVLYGKEYIGWSELDGLAVQSEKFSEGGDIAFYYGEPTLWLPMTEGYFTLLFPQDAHMPNIKVDKPEKVKKVVVKIAVD